MTVINQACRLPTMNAAPIVPANDAAKIQRGRSVMIGVPRASTGANAYATEANTVPLNAIIEPADRSIPPEIMTTAAPRARMPNCALYNKMD